MTDAPDKTAPPKPTPRTCPGCQSVMQVFLAGKVRLDRCFFCGGFYFDRGELSTVAGKSLEPPADGAEGTRSCAGCGEKMHTAQLESVEVDTCASCGGIYLDDGELEKLAGGVKITYDDKPPEGAVTFRCPLCGDTFDVAVGVTTAGGLACPVCAPELDSDAAIMAAPTPPADSNAGPRVPGELRMVSLALNALQMTGVI